MRMSSRPLVLVPCRHCLRPVTLIAGEVDVELLASLRAHVRGCAPSGLRRTTWSGEDRTLLDHFRLAGA